jgi:hypothetical protein
MTDTTKNWSPDWVEDWMRVPYNPMQDRAAFNFSTGGPCAAIPRDPVKVTEAESTTNSSGWQRPVELGPQPGIDLIDRMVTAADQRERRQAQQPDVMQTMMQMLTMQSRQIATLAALVMRKDKSKAKAKRKSRQR